MSRARSVPLGIALALGALVGLAYLPALDAGFLNWDDDLLVTRNPHLGALSWRTVRWAFTTTYTGNWLPLSWLSHALDLTLYGLAPRGHHATSVVLHVANTVLLFLVLRSATGALWRSAGVAALFGLHPLHVESVAWVAERKDVLSTLFWLLTMAAYLRYVRRPTRASYGLVVAAFVAALMSKPMVVTLPAALLLLDYWPLRRLSRRALVEKLPLFALAAATAVVTVASQGTTGALRISVIPFTARLANALVSTVRYLELTAWPARLSPWYSHPALEGEPLACWRVAGAGLILVAATLAALATARRRPHLLVGWLWYLGTLAPVAGVLQAGGQAMADRFSYVPLIGIFVALVWEAGALALWSTAPGRRAGAAAAATLLAALAVLTWRQVGIWRDPETFWAYVLAVNPRAAVAYYARGGMLQVRGEIDAAIAAYRRAAKLRPDFMNAHTELGNLLARQGRFALAAAHYRKAIALRPAPAEDHANLANVLLRQGRRGPARRHLRLALALRPGFAEAHNNLGIVLAQDGDLDAAVGEFQAALAARPGFAPARTNLAAVQAALRERAPAREPPR
jgi:tetratricopeptide (TPR) repeat protein